MVTTRKKKDQSNVDEIWREYKRTGEQLLRNKLIERYLPLVRYIAERLLAKLPQNIEFDDLQSAGIFGLMDAVDGFDIHRGVKFETYCTTRIRGAILDELRSLDWVPRIVRNKANRIDQAWKGLEVELGGEMHSTRCEVLGLSDAPTEETLLEDLSPHVTHIHQGTGSHVSPEVHIARKPRHAWRKSGEGILFGGLYIPPGTGVRDGGSLHDEPMGSPVERTPF